MNVNDNETRLVLKDAADEFKINELLLILFFMSARFLLELLEKGKR